MGKLFLRNILTATINIKNVILALLIDFHDPGRTVSMESNIYSGCFNIAKQFCIRMTAGFLSCCWILSPCIMC